MKRKGSKNNSILNQVFSGIRKGKSLYVSCVETGISSSEFYDLICKNEDAKKQYCLALADYADQCTDTIREIAKNLRNGEIDNSTAKLLIETEKWLAQKANSEPFSFDKNNGGDDEVTEIEVKFI